MRDAIAVLLSLALPWLAGALLVLVLRRRQPEPGWLLCAGYGYLLGAFATTLVMRALSLAGVRWSLPIVAGAVLALAAALALPVRARLAPAALRRDAASAWQGLSVLTTAGRALFAGCFALIAIRAASLGLEILWRPLLPFDALVAVGDEGQLWFDLGRVVPFVGQPAWFAPGDVLRYTDMHPAYPPTVPLLQVWTSLWLGAGTSR